MWTSGDCLLGNVWLCRSSIFETVTVRINVGVVEKKKLITALGKTKLTQKTQKVTNIVIVLYVFQSIYQLSHFLKKIENALLH